MPLDLAQPWNELPIVVIDTETTGVGERVVNLLGGDYSRPQEWPLRMIEVLFRALDRALRTLGPQPAQGGESVMYMAADYPKQYAENLAVATTRAEAAEEVLRDIACYVSAGGHNAPTVDPEMFRRKIRDGIDHEVDFWRKRAETAELKLTLGLNATPVAQELTAEDEAFVAGIEDMRPSVRAGKGNLLLAFIRKYHPRLRQGGGKPISKQLADLLEAAGTTVHFVTELARGGGWEPADYHAAHAAIREHAGFAVACDALDAVAYRLSAKPVAQELSKEERRAFRRVFVEADKESLSEYDWNTAYGAFRRLCGTAPKPAPAVDPLDPLEALLTEMREDADHDHSLGEHDLGHCTEHWIERLSTALAAQKAGG
jgi:hypothetical protein